MSYDEAYFTARESWRDWRIEARELIRLARIGRDERVLDIGCGGGGLMRIAHENGADAVGIDTLSTALHLARIRIANNAEEQTHKGAEENFPPLPRSPAPLLSLIQIGYDNHLPFTPNSFNAILGQHVIEHIADVDAALREWHRLLKPSGRVAIATPNVHYPDPAHFADADHAHIFSPNELRDTITRAGFVVEECFTIFPFLSHARTLRALSVVGYNVFRRMPRFADQGRTILLSARKN